MQAPSPEGRSCGRTCRIMAAKCRRLRAQRDSLENFEGDASNQEHGMEIYHNEDEVTNCVRYLCVENEVCGKLIIRTTGFTCTTVAVIFALFWRIHLHKTSCMSHFHAYVIFMFVIVAHCHIHKYEILFPIGNLR